MAEPRFAVEKKVGQICRWSYKVSCGNDYLCEYARQFNNDVILNPTTIDTIKMHNLDMFPQRHRNSKSESKIVIGWTGSHSTLKYLLAVEPVLQTLENKYPQLHFLVIANKDPELKLSRITFKPWSLSSEVQDLIAISIGIMPLPEDEWTKGKCGFKALQYMALEIPTVASPVGVNVKIIQDGINGFYAIRLRIGETNLSG